MPLLIPFDWSVPDQLAGRLGDTAGRQRAMSADGHLLLVLHEPPAAGVVERAARLFWRNPAGEWRSRGLGDGPQALKRHVAEFAARVEKLEQQWQAAETATDYFRILRAVAPLHRTVRNLHAAFQQARELVPADRDLINLRDQAGEVERAVELLHGDAKNGLDFTVARQAEQQAERSYSMTVAAHRLNVLVAAFFPVATLSAFYSAAFGMMVAHGDQTWSTPALFWALLLLGLVFGLLLAKAITRAPEPTTDASPKKSPKRRS